MERQQATGGPAGGGGATRVPDGGLRRPRTALAVLLLGSFIGVLDPFVVTVALPAIGLDLDAGFAQTQWVIAAYGTAYAAGLVCGARLGDLFGRRRLFVGGTVLYSLGSVAAGAAPTAGALIGARDVQGLGAAAMLPQILSIIRMDFPPAARGRAIGRYGARIGLGVVSGPVLGGLLLAAAPGGWGWRAIFLLNLPLGVVVAAGALLAVLGPRGRGTGGVDLVGAALSAAALLALVVPVTQAASTGWPWWSTAALASAPVLLIGFLAHERRVEARGSVPLVPRRLFRSHEFSRGLGAVLLLYAAGAGAPLILLLTFHLQEGLGASALRTGIVFAPLGLGFAAASALAARLTARWGSGCPPPGPAPWSSPWGARPSSACSRRSSSPGCSCPCSWSPGPDRASPRTRSSRWCSGRWRTPTPDRPRACCSRPRRSPTSSGWRPPERSSRRCSPTAAGRSTGTRGR